MSTFLIGYQPVFDFFLLGIGFAFSQWIVLRAGMFSVATAGFASIGAYTAGILAVDYGVTPILAILAAVAVATVGSLIMSFPLVRLRGVYQAIATIAFVQIIVSLMLFSDGVTHGAVGVNGIPRVVGTITLLIAAGAITYLMLALSSTRLGRTYEVIREDEAVAASLGVSVTYQQTLAFVLSGAIAGLFGALEAFHSYSIVPDQFGFTFLVAALSYVILGGRRSVLGPIVGAAILLSLPEIARPLAEFRMLVFGLILMAAIAFLPHGVVDTVKLKLSHRRLARSEALEAQP